MRYRLFGDTGLRLSELILGTMTFGEQGGVGAPPEECGRILDAYADAVLDGICRPVSFVAYDGTLSWRSGDDVIESSGACQAR